MLFKNALFIDLIALYITGALSVMKPFVYLSPTVVHENSP